MRSWTFGRKIGAGFAAVIALTVAISVLAVFELRQVVQAKDRVIGVNAQVLVDAEKLEAVSERKAAAAESFLLSGDERFAEAVASAQGELTALMAKLKPVVDTAEGSQLLTTLQRLNVDEQRAVQRAIEARRAKANLEAAAAAYLRDVGPLRTELDRALSGLVQHEERLLEEAKHESTRGAATAMRQVVGLTGLAVLMAGLLGFFLTRSLGRQVGSAVQHVQSSSSELQAAANQQATGAKEQATAMNEITTTISELLVTSRQIADSAQRVAHIAGETAGAARGGDQSVQRTRESIGGIKRQVDTVVAHMLDLGKKSQQIGSVLEIINELAEQTNILAINASIEAVGAGEGGKRFGVVADEIRKLADRVTGSTKEIRVLIDDIRAAVNATVMATESGSKAVDAGTRQFDDVASVFVQIASLVTTTTEAAREIELSTKQQTTAVEQVKAAIADVAQATKEMEASSGQTLQTSSQLLGLSRNLAQLVRLEAGAR